MGYSETILYFGFPIVIPDMKKESNWDIETLTKKVREHNKQWSTSRRLKGILKCSGEESEIKCCVGELCVDDPVYKTEDKIYWDQAGYTGQGVCFVYFWRTNHDENITLDFTKMKKIEQNCTQYVDRLTKVCEALDMPFTLPSWNVTHYCT